MGRQRPRSIDIDMPALPRGWRSPVLSRMSLVGRISKAGGYIQLAQVVRRLSWAPHEPCKRLARETRIVDNVSTSEAGWTDSPERPSFFISLLMPDIVLSPLSIAGRLPLWQKPRCEPADVCRCPSIRSVSPASKRGPIAPLQAHIPAECKRGAAWQHSGRGHTQPEASSSPPWSAAPSRRRLYPLNPSLASPS